MTTYSKKTSVMDLDLSVRARNVLKNNSVNTLEEMRYLTEVQLMSFKKCGYGTAKEIMHFISNIDFNELVEDDEHVTPEQNYQIWIDEHKDEVKSYFERNCNERTEELGLSVRSTNGLKINRLNHLSDFIVMDYDSLKKLNHLGAASAEEIVRLTRFYLRSRKEDIIMFVDGFSVDDEETDETIQDIQMI